MATQTLWWHMIYPPTKPFQRKRWGSHLTHWFMTVVFQLPAHFSKSNTSPQVNPSHPYNHSCRSIPAQTPGYSWKHREESQPCCRLSYRSGDNCIRHGGVSDSNGDTCLVEPRSSSWRNRRVWYEEKVDAARLADPRTRAKLFTIRAACHICLKFRIGVIHRNGAECQWQRQCVASRRTTAKMLGKSVTNT